MSNFYKLTKAEISKTKNGHEIYKLELDSRIVVTKLVPFHKDRKYDKLYQIYKDSNNSFDPIIGKIIVIDARKNSYGYEFRTIYSFDMLGDFKKELDSKKGNVFSTKLPIYKFLKMIGRKVEYDNSIKIKSEYGELCISEDNICYRTDISSSELNFDNIALIFDNFYKNIDLPAYDPQEGGKKSYYTMDKISIIRMENHVKVSYRMTTSGDYDKWVPSTVLKIGDKLTEEQISFLNSTK
ncbi:TPA: hypothetical protein P0E36_005351 [Vibrio harveyi]|nr:hypothetical protein [Vibrio harveyi]